MLSYFPFWLKSKYFLTSISFVVWMIFFDDRDLITTYFTQPQELRTLESSRDYYNNQISGARKEIERLKTNATTIEQYAREKYRMKKSNEDLFIVETPKKAN